MNDVIKTVINRGYAEITEKKSRFIANISPVKSEDEAKAFIDEIKKSHYNARHNVFAYIIGENSELKGFSDGGEPQGTAGMPVLNVLVSEDIKNTIIVVTRYFGGILLGTGGLVRAYTAAAKAGLEDAGICEIQLYRRFEISCDYTLNGKIQYELLKGGYFVEDTVFTERVKFKILVENERAEGFVKMITELTSAKAEVTETDILRGACKDGSFKLYE